MVSVSFLHPQHKEKDTSENIRATKGFTVNIISEPFVTNANFTSIDAPEDVDEWIGSGLTREPSVRFAACEDPMLVMTRLNTDYRGASQSEGERVQYGVRGGSVLNNEQAHGRLNVVLAVSPSRHIASRIFEDDQHYSSWTRQNDSCPKFCSERQRDSRPGEAAECVKIGRTDVWTDGGCVQPSSDFVEEGGRGSGAHDEREEVKEKK